VLGVRTLSKGAELSTRIVALMRLLAVTRLFLWSIKPRRDLAPAVPAGLLERSVGSSLDPSFLRTPCSTSTIGRGFVDRTVAFQWDEQG